MTILRNNTSGRKDPTGNPIPAAWAIPIPGDEATLLDPVVDEGLSLDPEAISTSPDEDGAEQTVASLRVWGEEQVYLEDEDYCYLDPWDAGVDPDASAGGARLRSF
jgi:hypothetical protein